MVAVDLVGLEEIFTKLTVVGLRLGKCWTAELEQGAGVGRFNVQRLGFGVQGL